MGPLRDKPQESTGAAMPAAAIHLSTAERIDIFHVHTNLGLLKSQGMLFTDPFTTALVPSLLGSQTQWPPFQGGVFCSFDIEVATW